MIHPETHGAGSTPEPAHTPYRLLAWTALVVGGLLACLGVCGALVFIFLPRFQAAQALATNTALASFVALTLLYGSSLLLLGIALPRGRLTRTVRLPAPLLLIALFGAAIVVGQSILTINIGAAYLFPIWHILAALLAPLAVLAFIIRRLPPMSVRVAWTQFAWGGLVTVLFALTFEFVIGVVLLVLVAMFLMLWLGPARVIALATAAARAEGIEERLRVAQQEPGILLVGGLAALLLFTVLAPLLEEIIKSLGPAILLARQRRDRVAQLTRSHAVLWGLVAGAGYAFTENLLNTQGALGEPAAGLGLWAGVMTLRLGTSIMHMAATATVSAGWYGAVVQGKLVRLPLFLGLAWMGHGLWNLAALVLGSISVLALVQVGGGQYLFGGALILLVLFVLVILCAASLAWLLALMHWTERSHA